MPLVTTNVNDVLGIPIPLSLAPRVAYKLSGLGGNGVFSFLPKPVYAYSDITGLAVVNLIATDGLRPPGLHYEVSIEVLDPGINYTQIYQFSGDLYLSETGGNLADLLDLRIRADQSWVSPGAVIPPAAQPGDWLFDPTSDNFFRIH